MEAFFNRKILNGVPRGTILVPRSYAPGTLDRCVFLLPSVLFGVFLLVLGTVAALSGYEQMRSSSFRASLAGVPVQVSLANPKMNQESVDVAMATYSIKLPAFTAWPYFNSDLADRGLTTGGTLDFRRSVLVGPSAFTSWGVLGSTLGHEIEIHCEQSFGAVLVLDLLSSVQDRVAQIFRSPAVNAALLRQQNRELSWGTWRAERVAYAYELSSAGRFGLRSDEVDSIQNVMNYYYPVARGGVAAKRLSTTK
jgi:hypothetical protein